jgi:signal transduction histidine kinase
MARGRLRTKFLVSLLLVSAGLTCATLLIVQRSVRSQVRKGIADDLHNSVMTFQNFHQQTDITRIHSAALMASQPELKALMTTHDPATIQDSSADMFRVAGGDLLVLVNRSGQVVALNPQNSGFTVEEAQGFVKRSLEHPDRNEWWFGGGRLYQVFIQPIYFGPPSENSLLGVVAIGYEVNDRVANSVSRIANSQVAFWYGNSPVVSTLPDGYEKDLKSLSNDLFGAMIGPKSVQLDKERFLATTVDLGHDPDSPVRLTVLKSYDQATVFLMHLNRMLLLVGLLAIAGGSLLVFFISHTFTRPLENLVGGVRALEKGNFSYPTEVHGADEIAELTSAFNRMRQSIRLAQEQLVESERLATIGRMASSISHDLRHPLTAVVANAEFLCDSRPTEAKPEELYQEIRVAVNQITDLIDSLLEFSKGRESLRPSYGSLRVVLEEIGKTMQALPEFQQVRYVLRGESEVNGWFDTHKIRRAFYNVLRNAFEAAPARGGVVEVTVSEIQDHWEVMIADNGAGIPAVIRDRLFEPFISHGKVNGTGLGLTIAQKIFQEHGGDIDISNTSAGHTVFRVVIPRPDEITLPAKEGSISSISTIQARVVH